MSGTGVRLGSIAQLFTVIAIFLLVLLLAWFSARMVARYNRVGVSAHGNMELIEAFRLTQSQVVELLRIGERYVAIAVSKDQVERLGEWSKEELGLSAGGETTFGGAAGASGFQALFAKYMKGSAGTTDKEKQTDEAEETQDASE